MELVDYPGDGLDFNDAYLSFGSQRFVGGDPDFYYRNV
jgi:hypothetical protein